GPVLPTPFRAETLLHAVDEALAAEPLTDEPVTDMFGSAPIPIETGPEIMDLDWESPTGPMATAEPDEPILDPAQLSAPAPLPAPDRLEAFDAGPLLEAEPELEPEPVLSPDDELLHAAEEPVPVVAGLHPELEHTAPMLAVAAGAWSAATDDRLAPISR